MKKSLIFIVALHSFGNLLYAQERTTNNGTLINQRFGLFAGYYGYKYTYPGFQIGIENYLATTKNFEAIGMLNLQFHHQKEVQTGIGLNIRIGQRFKTNFGLTFEGFLGIGIENTFYTSKVYDLTINPVSPESIVANKKAFIPNIAFGLGYDFTRKTKLPITFYLRQNVTWLLPDKNLVFYTSPSFETGVVYRLKKKH